MANNRKAIREGNKKSTIKAEQKETKKIKK